MRIVLTLVILLLISQSAIASEFVKFNEKTYIKIEKTENDLVYYWVKTLNNGSFSKVDGQKVWYYLSLYQSDCSSNTIKSTDFYIYSIYGTVLGQDTNYELPSTPIPQTNGEYWHNYVCKSITKEEKQ